MVFDFLTKTAQAAVDVACDTGLALMGESDGPTREDVAQLLAAGLTVGAIAVAFNVAEDAIQDLVDK